MRQSEKVTVIFPMILCVVLALFSCGGPAMKPPSLQVAALKFNGIGLSGAKLDVSFNVRNVNSDPLVIDRFEYELFLNGKRLGRGFYPDKLELAGFADTRVVSPFDINFLSVPGTVKAILNQDQVNAHVEGTFYVKGGKKLKFANEAQINMQRGNQ